MDFRGKPRAGTDYDAILYGVQDRGAPDSGNPPQKFSGISLLMVGQSDLGKGWTARGSLNYITSFRFRQEWSESYSDSHRFGNSLGRLRQQELVHLHPER